MWRALLLVGLLLVGCQGKPAAPPPPSAPYVGTWSAGEVTLTLSEGGVLVFGSGIELTKTGTWKDHGNGLLEIQGSEGGPSGLNRWWVSSDGRTLTLTPQDGGQPVAFTKR